MNTDEICKKCNKPSPPNEVSIPANENVDWLQCERCYSWYHAVCVQDKLLKIGITTISEETLNDVNFYCCDE